MFCPVATVADTDAQYAQKLMVITPSTAGRFVVPIVAYPVLPSRLTAAGSSYPIVGRLLVTHDAPG